MGFRKKSIFGKHRDPCHHGHHISTTKVINIMTLYMRHHDWHSDGQHHDHDNDDQHNLHFQTFTGGKQCLLLHGWLDNAGTWDRVAILINLINLLGLIILNNLTLAGLALLDITLKVT